MIPILNIMQDTDKRINKLTTYLEDAEQIICNLEVKYENVKKEKDDVLKKNKEIINKIDLLEDTIIHNEKVILNNKEQLLKYENDLRNFKIQVKKLEKDLDIEIDRHFLKQIKVEELERTLNNFKNKLETTKTEINIFDQLETVIISSNLQSVEVQCDPLVTEVLLCDNLHVYDTLKYKNYIDQMYTYTNNLKRFYNKLMWFHRVINIISLFGVIYCTVNLYLCRC